MPGINDASLGWKGRGENERRRKRDDGRKEDKQDQICEGFEGLS